MKRIVLTSLLFLFGAMSSDSQLDSPDPVADLSSEELGQRLTLNGKPAVVLPTDVAACFNWIGALPLDTELPKRLAAVCSVVHRSQQSTLLESVVLEALDIGLQLLDALQIDESLEELRSQQELVKSCLSDYRNELMGGEPAKRSTNSNGRYQNLGVAGVLRANSLLVTNNITVGGKVILPSGESVAGPNSTNLRSIAIWGDTNGDSLLSTTPTVNVDGRIQNVTDPELDQDVATRKFVEDSTAFDARDSVRAVSVGTNETLSGVGADIDGVIVAANDRVLLTSQTNAVDNGIWLVQAGSWVRPADFADGTSAASAYVFVEEGTTYMNTGWVCTNNDPNAVVGTNSLDWTQFAASGVTSVGAFSNTPTANGMEITATQVLTLHAADATNPGGVSTTTQTFGGAKTFAGGIVSTATNQAINIGADTVAGSTVNVGTGAVAKTVTVGNTTGATNVTVQSGTAGVNVNNSNNQPTNINTGTSTGTVAVGGSGNQTIGIGNNAAGEKTIGIGNAVAATATNISGGSTGGVNVNNSVNSPTNINTGTSTGVVTVGNTANAGNINIRSAEVITITTQDADDNSIIVSAQGTNGGVNILGNTTGTGAVDIQSGSGAVNVNASVNNNTNINTGTSTGATTVGNNASGGVVGVESASSIQIGQGQPAAGNRQVQIGDGGTGAGGENQVRIATGTTGTSSQSVFIGESAVADPDTDVRIRGVVEINGGSGTGVTNAATQIGNSSNTATISLDSASTGTGISLQVSGTNGSIDIDSNGDGIVALNTVRVATTGNIATPGTLKFSSNSGGTDGDLLAVGTTTNGVTRPFRIITGRLTDGGGTGIGFSWVNGTGAGEYDVTFTEGDFSITPYIVANAERNSGLERTSVQISARSVSGFSLQVNGTGIGASREPVNFIAIGQGVAP